MYHLAYAHRRQIRAFALALLFAIAAGCASLPPLHGRPASTADFNTADTRLGRAIAPRVAAHPGLTGLHTLQDGSDAFTARMLLAKAADRTLDVQYYIWRNDMTGTMLLQALREAAGRGVRVRLLLDDNNTAGLDSTLGALDAHPNIEVRLFNPFAVRTMRALGFVSDFSRVNRRMHNKSFTADSQATIIGGRNVGDEYFGAADDMLFADLDVMAIGPAVRDVANDFDRYWSSDSAYPAQRLLGPVDPLAAQRLAAAAQTLERSPRALAYSEAMRGSTFHNDLTGGRLALEWARTRMVSDDPAKALGLAPDSSLIFGKMKTAMGEPQSTVNLVSPYFVPTQSGVETLVQLTRRGVKVQVLTNALEATDVAAVHAGYARYRKALLQAGVRLFELRRQAGAPRPAQGTGSSSSSLHSKTFSVDRTRVFIGSFNFDPRSAMLNTEMGFVIDSAVLADRIAEAFAQRIPAAAYEVRLSPEGKLYWLEQRGGETVRHDVEPGTTAMQRAGVALLSLLPIEWLL